MKQHLAGNSPEALYPTLRGSHLVKNEPNSCKWVKREQRKHTALPRM